MLVIAVAVAIVALGTNWRGGHRKEERRRSREEE